MITSIQEFEEAVLFELLALETFIGSGESTTSSTLDLTDPDGIVRHHCILSLNDTQHAVDEFKNKILPLAFGAGWKVLDLMIELILNQSGYRASVNGFTYAEKQRQAQNTNISSSILGCDSATWQSILGIYANTLEHRHCLVHRTANIDENSGEFNGFEKSNNIPLIPLTRIQQFAFAKSAAQVARGIIGGGILSRNEADLKYYLNQLTTHSGAQELPDAALDSSANLVIDFENDGDGYFLNMSFTLMRARTVLPDTTYFDVMIRNPNDCKRHYFGRAEKMPTQKTYVDLSSIPDWLIQK
jgi:hypothetical protein